MLWTMLVSQTARKERPVPSNKYLLGLIACVVLLVVIVIAASRGGAPEPSPEAPPAPVFSATGAPQDAPPPAEPLAPRQTVQERAQSEIEAYEQQLRDDPQHPDAAALNTAIGNFYRHKLLDCEKAIPYYTAVILEHSEWPGAQPVYMDLASCYLDKGDQTGANWVYARMMERFPEDSQEYLYAKTQLGL